MQGKGLEVELKRDGEAHNLSLILQAQGHPSDYLLSFLHFGHEIPDPIVLEQTGVIARQHVIAQALTDFLNMGGQQEELEDFIHTFFVAAQELMAQHPVQSSWIVLDSFCDFVRTTRWLSVVTGEVTTTITKSNKDT